MAVDPNSHVGQSENANDKLSGYFNELNKFLVTMDGSVPPPDFEKVVDSLDYSELHRITSIQASDNANFANGAAIESIHQMVAVMREYNIRRKGKINYYEDAASESQKESDYYATLKVFSVNMLNGIYIDGELV